MGDSNEQYGSSGFVGLSTPPGFEGQSPALTPHASPYFAAENSTSANPSDPAKHPNLTNGQAATKEGQQATKEGQGYYDVFPSLSSSSKPAQPATAGTWKTGPPLPKTVNREVTERIELGQDQILPSSFEPQKGKRGIGENNMRSIVKYAMSESGSEVVFSVSKNRGVTLLITGKPEKNSIAKKILLNKLCQSSKIIIQIPIHLHKFIVGQGGKNLINLQNKTGAKVIVPKPELRSDQITLVGETSAIRNAQQQIVALCQQKAAHQKETVDLDKTFLPFLLGDTELLHNIRSETNCKIIIDASEATITFIGEKLAIDQAKNSIFSLIEEAKTSGAAVTVTMPKKYHPYLVGPKRSFLQMVFQKTRCIVVIPSPEDPSENIVIRGPNQNIAQAVSMVMEKGSEIEIKDVPIKNRFIVRYLKDFCRASIHQIELKTSAQIHVQDKKVEIHSSKSGLETTISEVTTLISQAEKLKFKEISLPTDVYGLIIGKKYQNIYHIKEKYKVEVSVPNTDSNTNEKVLLCGLNNSDIEQVEKLLDETVKKASLVSEEIKVDRKFYKVIASQTINKLKEENETVSIYIPFSEDKEGKLSDTIRLRGTADQVTRVKEKILSIVEETRHRDIMHSYTETISVDADHIKFLIGKGGTGFTSIEKSLDVKIRVDKGKEKEESEKKNGEKPKEEQSKNKAKKSKDSSNEKITVTIVGTPKSVEQAKDQLSKKAKELADGGGLGQDTMEIPPKYHRYIIGAKGRNLVSLKERYGVNVSFPQDESSSTIKLTGFNKSIKKAKVELKELLEDFIKRSYSETVQCETQYLQKLLPMKFRKVNQEEVENPEVKNFWYQGCRCEILNEKEITVVGIKNDVEKVLTLLKYEADKEKNSISIEVTINPKYYSLLIGQKGEKINQTRDKFNVDVYFPDVKSSSHIVTISGLKKNVNLCKDYLLKTIKDSEAQRFFDSVTIDERVMKRSAHRLAREIQDISGVQIKCVHPDKVQFHGEESNVKTAMDSFLMKLPMIEEVQIDQKYVSSIKSKLVKIGVLHHVDLEIPRDGNIVRIFGEKDDVSAAKTRLQSEILEVEQQLLSKSLEKQKILNIAQKYHGLIIGKQGSRVREIMNITGASIKVEKNDDKIRITGSADQVLAAEKEINSIIQARETRKSVEVSIEKKFYPQLIGQRGSSKRQLEAEHGVEIRFPREGSRSNAVEIKGDVKAAQSAKEHLLELVENIKEEQESDEEPISTPQPEKDENGNDDIEGDEFFMPIPTNTSTRKTPSVWSDSVIH